MILRRSFVLVFACGAIAAGCAKKAEPAVDAGPAAAVTKAAAPTPVKVAAPTPPAPMPPAPMPAPPVVVPPAVKVEGAAAQKPGDLVPSFEAKVARLDGAGERTLAFASRASKVTAYVVVGTKCPATRAYRERMKAVAETYQDKGVRFLFVYPNVDDTPESKRAFHREAGFSAPLLDDRGAAVAKGLGATRTSEIVIFDRGGKLAFRGPVDDNRVQAQAKKHFVADALDALLAGKSVEVPFSQVFA